MGTSTDGILAFGVDFGDEDCFDETLPEELREILEKTEGLEDYLIECSGIGEWSEDFTAEENSEYWDKRQKVIKDAPVEEVTHCSYDYPMTILRFPALFAGPVAVIR